MYACVGSATSPGARNASGGKSSFQFMGVMTQFKESLGLLMETIGATQV